MTRTTDLTPLLKRLQLGPMAATLPERIALARREQLDYASFLEIILSDEVNRRADRRIELRLQGAGFEETCRLEDFDWSAAITLDRRLLDAVFSLEFLAKHEHVLLVGPAGVGKSFLAQALGFTAIRAGYTVRFVHSDDFFRAMAQARVVDVKQASTNSVTKRAGRFNGNRSSRVGGMSHICARSGKPGYLPAGRATAELPPIMACAIRPLPKSPR